jgi:hypothetical protein
MPLGCLGRKTIPYVLIAKQTLIQTRIARMIANIL